MRWTWSPSCGRCLAAALLATWTLIPSWTRGEDRLTRLAQQLAESEPSADRATVSAALADTAKPTSDPVLEKRPLGRAEGPGPSTQPLPSPRWGSGWVLNTVTALGVVILVIFALRTLLVKLGAAKGVSPRSGVVEVLSRTAIAPRNHVLLIRVAGRVLVVGDSVAGLRTLAQIDDPDEVASLLAATTAQAPHSVTRGFATLMGRFNRQYDEGQRLLAEGGDESEHAVDRARDGLSSLLARVRATRSGGEGPA